MIESQAQNHLVQHWFVDHVMHNPVIIINKVHKANYSVKMTEISHMV